MQDQSAIHLQEVRTISFFALLLGIVAAYLLFAYLARRLRSTERIRAIENGLPVTFMSGQDVLNTRRSAILLLSLSAGILLTFVAISISTGTSSARVGCSLAILPAVLGLGLLLEYRLLLRSSRSTDLSTPKNDVPKSF
jgi:ribose/xylose/arabinose/galactoside ABC-type transport system permease subunit